MAKDIYVRFIRLKPDSTIFIPYKIANKGFTSTNPADEFVSKMDKLDFKVFSCLFAKRLSSCGIDDILTDAMKKYCLEVVHE